MLSSLIKLFIRNDMLGLKVYFLQMFKKSIVSNIMKVWRVNLSKNTVLQRMVTRQAWYRSVASVLLSE